MAQFDVHRNPERATRDRVPFVVDLQSDLLADLPTRLVAPLYRLDGDGPPAPRRLCPSFVVQSERVTLFPQEMAGVPTKSLGRVVCSLRAERALLIDAVDAVLSGL